jgi:hypothetical protein
MYSVGLSTLLSDFGSCLCGYAEGLNSPEAKCHLPPERWNMVYSRTQFHTIEERESPDNATLSYLYYELKYSLSQPIITICRP